MPQPLSRVRADANISIGNNWDNPSDHRPELALLAMKVIAEWSILESFMQGLFVAMLGANPGPAAAIYAALTATATQKAAFKALAKSALSSDDERDVFDAILMAFDTVAKIRNDIAHGVWGHSAQIPDGVLLCDADVLMEYHVALREALGGETHSAMPTFPRDKMFVWKSQDFISASAQIQQVMNYVSQFQLALRQDHLGNRDAQRLQRLLSEPPIHQTVSRIRERRDNPRATQQSGRE